MNFRQAIYKTGIASGVAAAIALGVSANGLPAFASTPRPAGQPGLIQVPVTQGAYTGSGWPTITVPRRYVWRSAASADTQVIAVTYRVWKYDATSGGWPLYTSHTETVAVAPAGTGSWLTGWYFNLPFDSFAMNVLITWTAPDGTQIGSKVIDYNTATDYQCLTGSTCQVLPNASVGAFIYLHPAPKPVPTPVPTAQTTQPTTGSTFNVGGGNIDLGVGAGTRGSITVTIGGDSLPADATVLNPSLDMKNFGFGGADCSRVPTSAERITCYLALPLMNWAANHTALPR
jgi:hypothetical protein